MGNVARAALDLIHGRPDHDALMQFLANNVGEVQRLAGEIQKAGMSFGDVVVPIRFGHLLSAGDVKLLGHPVVIGNVERIGLVTLPVD